MTGIRKTDKRRSPGASATSDCECVGKTNRGSNVHYLFPVRNMFFSLEVLACFDP